MHIKSIALLLFISSFIISKALCQETRSLGQSKQIMKMDEGVELMNQGKFELADDLFKEVLKGLEVVPADLCFYFGKNSYHLGKARQSIDWLNKYIELKGTSGRFFDQAVVYLDLSETDIQSSVSTSDNIINNEPKSKARPAIDCSRTPIIQCPVCEGEGVLVESGPLGTSLYKSCVTCDEKGSLSCENYLLYLKGQYNP